MTALSVCLLTFNSERLLSDCLTPLLRVADEIIVVDSGSTDATLSILASAGISPHYRRYTRHGDQMNYAISLCSSDWVLCVDSDEILDDETVSAIIHLKTQLEDPRMAYRINRHWYVMGQRVHALYPVSSPDYPVRLFNRRHARFNDSPVDDKPVGFADTTVIPGRVRHDTFHSVHEVFKKVNDYTSRLNKYRPITPSITRAILSAMAAFWKWYFLKGSWRDGRVGVLAGAYASIYSFLKYFKAWV